MKAAYNTPTLDESLYNDYKAGKMTLKECAKEFCVSGWTNFVDIDFTKRKFAKIENRRR